MSYLDEEQVRKDGIVYFDQTYFSANELNDLLARADEEDRPSFLSWQAFGRSWESSGYSVRFLSYCAV